MCQIRRGKREETIDFRQMDGETGTFKMKFLYIVYIIRIKSTTSYTCLSRIQNDCSTKLYRLFIYHIKITYNGRTSSAYNKY